ncbi:hypothetical protein NDU88_001194 [Pleurodeles waltl]|uniref:Uncharacterized protein n=1 Tax=Pleurodeles waltl TaxID=8319 RepID=A0AAV7Q6D0_PLEWA|nr:hypothetical protein NDU88_001194 [Pleurodeles waltl]
MKNRPLGARDITGKRMATLGKAATKRVELRSCSRLCPRGGPGPGGCPRRKRSKVSAVALSRSEEEGAQTP